MVIIMKLNKFRVTNFRSIQDSGWVECNDVTTLVGINESGKSNLLLALWKLRPARGGEIDILHDMPVSKLSSLRNKLETTPFICGEFTIDEDSADYISCTLNYLYNQGIYYENNYKSLLQNFLLQLFAHINF